jgi:predicted acetyltransferase
MSQHVEYLPDNTIDSSLDQELRALLTTCFTKPQDVVFGERRYFKEPYPHRWVIRDDRGGLVSHIGVHVKSVCIEGRSFPVGGIAEVCVHPDCRGRGYVKRMLHRIHEWLPEHGFVFAMLFGDPEIYGSSGYVSVANLFHQGADGQWAPVSAMVRCVSETPWPPGEVRLPGLIF